MLIALSGYAGSGKDSIADVLVAEHRFKKYAWADTLRIAAGILNPVVGWASYGAEPIRYNDALELVGYVEAKIQFPEFREFLQKLGTDVGRNLIDDDVWVNATLNRISKAKEFDSNIVFTDTRFPNEANAVRNLGGYVVRIERPGVGPVNDHPSETSLDDYYFNAITINAGPFEELPTLAGQLLEILRNSSQELASS